MRRSLTVDADGVVASLANGPVDDDADDTTTRILDAAAELYATIGPRRCSVEDIAERSGLGRTTIYRRFDGRQQILEAVIGREVRRFFASILAPTAGLHRFNDVVVESFVHGLASSETSLLAAMVRSEPELLALLTIDGGPIIDAAREFLLDLTAQAGVGSDADTTATLVEVLVRLAISLVLTPSATFPLDDPDTALAALHRVLDPILAALAP